MKRLFNILLLILLAAALSACGQQPGQELSMEEKQESSGQAERVEIAPPAENSIAKELRTQEDDNTMKNDIAFNFETKTVMLNSGYEMPIYGIGTYSLTDEVCVDSITAALENGVRLIDTAYMYHNDVICCEL